MIVQGCLEEGISMSNQVLMAFIDEWPIFFFNVECVITLETCVLYLLFLIKCQTGLVWVCWNWGNGRENILGFIPVGWPDRHWVFLLELGNSFCSSH